MVGELQMMVEKLQMMVEKLQMMVGELQMTCKQNLIIVQIIADIGPPFDVPVSYLSMKEEHFDLETRYLHFPQSLENPPV